jgi:hypothetical protein
MSPLLTNIAFALPPSTAEDKGRRRRMLWIEMQTMQKKQISLALKKKKKEAN